MQADLNGKQLDTVVSVVSEGWMPIHEGTVEHLEKEFLKGTYEVSRSALTKDIRRDPGLYLYCLRDLSENEKTSGLSPSEIFFYSSLDSIHASLRRAKQHTSRHSFTTMTELQAHRLHQTLLSAIASRRLAGSVTIDPDIGYACALLRQLGITLTAWNYPKEYEYAVQSASKDSSVEDRLNELFGFYPHALTNALLKQWNLPQEISDTVSLKNDAEPCPFRQSSDPSRYELVQAKLQKICQAAEAFARASHPEQNRATLSELESAEKILKSNLGESAIDSIFEEVRLQLRQYSPYQLSADALPCAKQVKQTIVRSVHSLELIENNKFLKHLPTTLREKVEDLYRNLQPEKISKTVVRALTREVFTELGFAQGCIYLFQPNKRVLIPSLSIGSMDLTKVRSIPVESAFAQYDFVVSAYSLKAPLRSERADSEGNPITAMAACIGESAPAGVLYLETKTELLAQIEPDPLLIFRAAHRMISDALNAK